MRAQKKYTWYSSHIYDGKKNNWQSKPDQRLRYNVWYQRAFLWDMEYPKEEKAFKIF